MCRFLAYLGPPMTLEELLLRPPHSLLRQSWAPRHQRHGAVNADGFGAGWYAPALRPEPARYRNPRPMGDDRSFASLAGVVHAGAVVGIVRNASSGLAVDESNTPPYTAGRWLFAHNGVVDDFRERAAAALRAMVSTTRAGGIEGATDSEVLFALALDRVDAGAEPTEALADVVRVVDHVVPARLNLVLTDGTQVAATAAGDSLFVLHDAGLARGGSVVASEPFDDDPAWRPVPDRSLVRATADHLTIGALPG